MKILLMAALLAGPALAYYCPADDAAPGAEDTSTPMPVQSLTISSDATPTPTATPVATDATPSPEPTPVPTDDTVPTASPTEWATPAPLPTSDVESAPLPTDPTLTISPGN